MKRLNVIAFLAALGLLFAGCGGGGGGSSSAVTKPVTDNTKPKPTVNCAEGAVCTDENGFTTATYYIDPETGKKVSLISQISSSATGTVPPRAPSYVRPSGTATSVSTK